MGDRKQLTDAVTKLSPTQRKALKLAGTTGQLICYWPGYWSADGSNTGRQGAWVGTRTVNVLVGLGLLIKSSPHLVHLATWCQHQWVHLLSDGTCGKCGVRIFWSIDVRRTSNEDA